MLELMPDEGAASAKTGGDKGDKPAKDEKGTKAAAGAKAKGGDKPAKSSGGKAEAEGAKKPKSAKK
jgi:hypothetical protein